MVTSDLPPFVGDADIRAIIPGQEFDLFVGSNFHGGEFEIQAYFAELEARIEYTKALLDGSADPMLSRMLDSLHIRRARDKNGKFIKGWVVVGVFKRPLDKIDYAAGIEEDGGNELEDEQG